VRAYWGLEGIGNVCYAVKIRFRMKRDLMVEYAFSGYASFLLCGFCGGITNQQIGITEILG
jgi:hypothetical protein